MNKSNDNSLDIQRELQKLGYWNNIYSKNDYFGTGPTKLANTAYEILKKFSLKNILELGCGQGRDSIFFAKNNFNVTALDISENAIRYVENIKHQQNLDNLKLLIHNLDNPLNTDQKFDLIYSNLALQFFDLIKLGKIFSNISSLMTENSFFLFSTKRPGDKYHNFGTKISNHAFEYKGITRFFFEKSELEKLLSEYFVVEIFETEQHVNLDKSVSVWWKILLKLPSL